MWNKCMFIIVGCQYFNILWMCGVLVKDLPFHDEGFKSLYVQPMYMPKGGYLGLRLV
jgi:hypothetical protein